MTLTDKLAILSAGAKYDVACASSGNRQRTEVDGRSRPTGCCHSWSDDGRCISLLKILFSNRCIYDCAYCLNRRSNPIPRATFSVADVVDLTLNFYRRNYIDGLFLSSAVDHSPDHTMEQLLLVARRLRQIHQFRGYIHVKAIPGASRELVWQTGLHADRISINIELPSAASLKRLAPDKNSAGILGPMRYIAHSIDANRDERKHLRTAPIFAPAGQSTQLIVGASPENDLHILQLSERLYQTCRLKRVYYSAYVAVNDDTRLPWSPAPDLLREHRLYQADWLVRRYGFSAPEILTPAAPYLDRDLDPKCAWALRHPGQFPIEINRADYETLLRVPGIGIVSAKRIVAARRYASVRMEDLAKLGVVVKRARFFITCGGRALQRLTQLDVARAALLHGTQRQPIRQDRGGQSELFDGL
jgi:putative DNA modification/repair radical SAM protein